MIEKESCKILWDCNVQTNHGLEAGCPDMIAIDSTVIYDCHMKLKENEKTKKCQDLAHDLKNFGMCHLRLSQ